MTLAFFLAEYSDFKEVIPALMIFQRGLFLDLKSVASAVQDLSKNLAEKLSKFAFQYSFKPEVRCVCVQVLCKNEPLFAHRSMQSRNSGILRIYPSKSDSLCSILKSAEIAKPTILSPLRLPFRHIGAFRRSTLCKNLCKTLRMSRAIALTAIITASGDPGAYTGSENY